jgi:hypothetical protein
MGQKLENALFDVQMNPFGVLFNPLSINKSIGRLLENRPFVESELFEYQGLWNSFAHSNLFSGNDKDFVIENINEKYNPGVNQLKNADFLIITFGTSWIYEWKDTGEVVVNCHKIPSEKFERRRLSVDEIVRDFTALTKQIIRMNPDITIIFSVSPVRHWKDGAHENNLSKSILLLAVNEIVSQFEQAMYFPAWEIQMDELRDYRFYAPDMLHPSQVAVDYIWEKFGLCFFDSDTNWLKNKAEYLYNMLQHKPIHPDSPLTEKFKENLQSEIQNLSNQFPFLADRINSIQFNKKG